MAGVRRGDPRLDRGPFLVISAGTRDHFAMDLGLDRDNPAACLDALTDDGVEQRIDLGIIGDRTFVNNASFGAYAEIVQSPAYRDDKRGTTLQLLPDFLAGHAGPLRHPATGAAGPGAQRPVRDPPAQARHRLAHPPTAGLIPGATGKHELAAPVNMVSEVRSTAFTQFLGMLARLARAMFGT